MHNKRQGIVVWFQHRKNIKHIKRFGNLLYVSRKMRYAVVYVNQSEIDTIEDNILKLPFISKVDRSYKPFLKTDFENAIPDKAKMYDYKMGM
ncbi:YlbG family protein [Pseudogracilibacillus auburnensis]|uniref:UPF0298 protein DFR56_1021 n=1 Tax=Pseudogracilibacillus auburnensis TaxID=1494959 RepID=A0A2V3WAQ2_9BACI|nr:DUF2129 domain-containing protein [Pseudogracilibacillus auburnensis]MBO1003536.1 DUF2129 domain-containing protein [Pseudogracilibacillus auburnensis]PXW89225.1 uncharacterized protein YlbG (UPF0298 family) [Pseudogracilibacillus auburnensis]